MSSLSLVGDQLADLGLFFLSDITGLAKIAGTLGGLLGKDVALVGLAPFDLAALGETEAFCGAPVGLDFRHGIPPKMISVLGSGLGVQDHYHISALLLCGALYDRAVLHHFIESVHNVKTDAAVADLPAAEANGDLDLVAAFQELLARLGFYLHIVRIDRGRKTDLLCFYSGLVTEFGILISTNRDL